MPAKLRPTPNGVIVSVYVHPSAKKDWIEAAGEIEVYTREPAVDNRANVAVIKMLSKALGIPRRNISIIRGSTYRVKELHIAGVRPGQLESLVSKNGIAKVQK
jgi:uncharacterized protein (TIGR00251 family)